MEHTLRDPVFGDFCTFCGTPHAADADWPRVCPNNKRHVMYRTVTTVAVALLPIVTPDSFALAGVRRNIPPKIGAVALPGGYIDGRNKKRPKGETWQEATVRELREESDELIDVPANEAQEWIVRSTDTDLCLVFGLLQPRPRAWFLEVQVKFLELKKAKTKEELELAETQELVLILGPETELAFPFHTEAANRWFKSADLTLAQMRALRA
jgi:ADP-ribose pyrophosphatase YjhB (NUDIX family)